MKTVTKIIPRYQETDKMGIIHHSVYPVWYECGRTDFCKELGMPFHKIEELDITQALIELNVKYHRPARYGEELILITYITKLTGVRVEFSYEIYNERKELVNTGSTTLVWLNDKLKPINIIKHRPDIYDLLLSSL